MNIIETKDLHYQYEDGTQALNGVDIAIAAESTTAILGSNGAGKSSLFLHLNGILQPTAGEVLFCGTKITYDKKSLHQLRAKVGLVFQDPDDQLFSANVYQDISFGALNMKLPEEVVRERVEAAMAVTKTSHLRDKPTHALSFGQKKRVAIAGCLVMEPELLILDEPTAGLDPMGVSELMKTLQEIQAERGLSLALATHDIDLIPLYSQYIYVLDHGEVVLQGTPKAVFAETALLREKNLRLPRIAHLMEILAKEDQFDVDVSAATISQARRELNRYRHRMQESKEEISGE